MSHYSKSSLGFTLVELMVSIAIVTVILTVIISNQSTYTDTAALAGLADEISLTISQAQVYSIGVRELSTGSQVFSSSYGLSFSLLSGNSGSNVDYIYFADRDSDLVYSGDWLCATGGECLSKTSITRGNYIESICVLKTIGQDQCDVGRVDISFTRPNTEAQVLFFDSNGQSFIPSDLKGAMVVLKSPKGSSMYVYVYQTGQISVQSVPPTPTLSCTGTYICSQWDGTDSATCTGNGHECSWNNGQQRCNGGAKLCTPFSEIQCTPTGCSWQ